MHPLPKFPPKQCVLSGALGTAHRPYSALNGMDDRRLFCQKSTRVRKRWISTLTAINIDKGIVRPAKKENKRRSLRVKAAGDRSDLLVSARESVEFKFPANSPQFKFPADSPPAFSRRLPRGLRPSCRLYINGEPSRAEKGRRSL